jgi:signal transduction histidine kinase
MSKSTQLRNQSILSAWLPVVVIGVTLLILGVTIFVASRDLRHKIRGQITEQDARILYALWLSQQITDEEEGLLGVTDDPADQLAAIMQATMQATQLSQLSGLLGTRLFDAHGSFVIADPHVSETTLDPELAVRLRRFEPTSRFRPAADLSEVKPWLAAEEVHSGPLLEICIPLHGQHAREIVGIAQFILDGSDIAAAFQQLDRHLFLQAAVAFAAAGGLLVVVLALAFRQLQRTNQLLTERTHGLLKANQELVMAAKSSAVGAVTSHLIHGLKNPLSGLQAFVDSQGAMGENRVEADWQSAVSSAKKMQSMISEIVRVLRDEHGAASYQLTLGEFVGLLESKVKPLAAEAGVRVRCGLAAEASLTNREANLMNLILYNLIQNAVQATPRGKSVFVSFSEMNERIICEVRDEGPGIPDWQQAQLFQPCQSTKGGCGVGLAISRQLASSLGAELELKATGPNGTTFVLAFSKARRNLPDLQMGSTASS